MDAVCITTTGAAAGDGNTNSQSRIVGKILNGLPEPDVQILTSAGRRIPAHSWNLSSISPVLETIIVEKSKKRGSYSKITFSILGVPCDAVSAFLGFIYSSSVAEEQMEKYGIHLVALSHVYQVPQLKQLCTRGIGQRLTAENAVDILQLARLCDAPDLCLRCMRLIYTHFKAVEQTDGWMFLQQHDPWLELDILRFMDEAESRKKRARRQRKEQRLYIQLSEAMDCLEHIFTEGCISMGPSGMDPAKKTVKPCRMFATCRGVQLLIRHFAACKKRVNHECVRCKRMWQLLKLHSEICDLPASSSSCRVPLCRQFRARTQQDQKEGDETRWKLLVRRVMSARAMLSLSRPKKIEGDGKMAALDMNRFIL